MSPNRIKTRAQIAAAAASVIPFHCVICFDEFNTTDRTPMVLPCGHTYVCLPCTKRLKRCMECRESLFLPVVNGTASNGNQHTNNNLRGAQHFSPNAPTTPTKPHPPPTAPKIPLPIPKNLVLMAMMEATERQCRNFKDSDDQGDDGEIKEKSSDLDEEPPFEPDQIVTGMATLAGPCGTYAVREAEGLVVLAQNPRKNASAQEEDDDNPVDLSPSGSDRSLRSNEARAGQQPFVINCEESPFDEAPFQETLFEEAPVQPRATETVKKKQQPTPEPYLVSYGQKLQVVNFEEGVACLARNQGFILATESQLVKIEGPLDESCRLEGLVDTVVKQRRDLQHSLQENTELEEKLQKQIQKAQTKTPTYPIITEASLPNDMDPQLDQQIPPHPTTPTNQKTLAMIRNAPGSEPSAIRQNYSEYLHADDDDDLAIPHSPISIDNADLDPAQSRETTATASSITADNVAMAYGCGALLTSVILGESQEPSATNGLLVRTHTTGGLTTELERRQVVPPTPSPKASPRYRPGWSPNSAANNIAGSGVSFRTGLSGHYGLSASARKARTNIRMRGEHGGIGGTVRGRRPKFA